MLEFEEYKVKLNGLKPRLDVLRDALHLDAAEKEIEELEAASARDEMSEGEAFDGTPAATGRHDGEDGR